MIKTILSNLRKRFSAKINLLTILEVICLLAVYPFMNYANASWFVEYGFDESSQLLILCCGIIISISNHTHKNLFKFIALILFFMILRETNMGRGYFCAQYLSEDELCRWSSFKYGFIPQTFRILLVFYAIYYFCRHRLYNQLWVYITEAPIYIFDISILFLSAIGGTLAECSFIDNEIMEESCELIFYITLCNCIWRYGRIKNI